MSFYDNSSLAFLPSSGAGKDGKAYSIKPTDGTGDFTFSRGSNLAATRVGPTGLIEKGRENLLVYSNDFSNAAWTKYATLTSGQSGYDGSSDAWLMSKSGANGSIVQNANDGSTITTFSIYAKAGDSDFMRVTSGGKTTFFNLLNGTINSGSNAIYNAIELIGNGWYRCITSVNPTSTNLVIYPAEDGSTTATSGSIYIQDAQVEQGLVARDYIETTTTAIYGGITDNVPRLDYTDSSCPALLLEPQRTNLYQHSEYIFNFQGTETFNAAVSPEGVSNAVLLTKTSASDQFVNMSWSGSSLSASTDYTMSLFVKHNGDDVDVRYEYNNSNDWGKGWNALFQVRASGVTASTTNLCTSDVEDYGNGWYRILVFVETASSITPSSPSNLLRVIGASGDDVLVYGAGMEQGSYATSYIPTYGSAVTRNTDAASKTGASDLIGQTEGTIFFEWSKDVLNFGSAYSYFQIGSYPSYVGIYIQASNCICEVVNSGVVQAAITKSSVSVGTHKAAVAYANNDIAFYFDGVQVGVDSLATIPSTSAIYLNSNNGIAEKINQSLIFKTRLTNEELATLTTI